MVFTRIEVEYRVRGRNLPPKAVERAIELSETRYCGASVMLGKTAEISTRYVIEEESE
jgi:putative redox protein